MVGPREQQTRKRGREGAGREGTIYQEDISEKGTHRKDTKEVVAQYVSRQGPVWPEPKKQEERGDSGVVVLSRGMALLWAKCWEDV